MCLTFLLLGDLRELSRVDLRELSHVWGGWVAIRRGPPGPAHVPSGFALTDHGNGGATIPSTGVVMSLDSGYRKSGLTHVTRRSQILATAALTWLGRDDGSGVDVHVDCYMFIAGGSSGLVRHYSSVTLVNTGEYRGMALTDGGVVPAGTYEVSVYCVNRVNGVGEGALTRGGITAVAAPL
jgi:hypothetical protein